MQKSPLFFLSSPNSCSLNFDCRPDCLTSHTVVAVVQASAMTYILRLSAQYTQYPSDANIQELPNHYRFEHLQSAAS